MDDSALRLMFTLLLVARGNPVFAQASTVHFPDLKVTVHFPDLKV
jgi:hypothetical protein